MLTYLDLHKIVHPQKSLQHGGQLFLRAEDIAPVQYKLGWEFVEFLQL